MITVFADRHLYKIEEIVPGEIDLNLYDPDKGLPENMEQADALLVRTVTPVNRETLSPLPGKLKFLATGSAGTDHIDKDFLQENDIAFAYAPGCNARAVAEYVVTALIIWGEENRIDLGKETIGIVGAGYVGSALREMLNVLEWPSILYDPPREMRDPAFKSAELDELLDCPILTFHTSLVHDGPYPTRYWLDEEKLENRRFKMVVSTARGGVIKEAALLNAIESRTVGDAIIDVWEEEPGFNDLLARKSFIATPHIAGYSVQSKFRASKMIVSDMIDFFSLDLAAGSLGDTAKKITLEDLGGSVPGLSDIVRTIHPIDSYHLHLQKLIGIPDEKKRKRFSDIRTSHPYGNEFSHIKLPGMVLESHPVLKKLFPENS